MLSPTTKKIVTSIILLLITVFFIFLALITIPLIERGTLLRVVTLPWLNWGYVYLSVQLSSIIMCLYSIENLFNVWKLTKIQTS
jgi:TRAP-type C4-dicarboxylate transport system permease small subunit